jgi:predicted N-acetyltransferase YhbS
MLRSPTKSDEAEFIALSRASVSFHRGLVSPPKTDEQFARFLQRSHREDSVCLLICLIADGAIIGAVNLSQIFRGGFQNAYLGYYVGAPYAGRGHMKEARRLRRKRIQPASTLSSATDCASLSLIFLLRPFANPSRSLRLILLCGFKIEPQRT